MKFFETRYLKGDIFGGLTAGIVALPLAMAFGVQSGLGAAAGLYGAIAIGIIAALFGGTATQVSGPTGPMTVVSSLVASAAIAQSGSIELGMNIVMLTFLLAGVFQIVFGFIQLGKLVQFIPYPVVSGFMTGIGLIIILLQIFPLMGHSSPGKIAVVFYEMQRPLQNINWAALILGLITIGVIYVFPKITKAVPSTLVALVAVSFIPQFVEMNIPKIGDIPEGLPSLNFGMFGDLTPSTLALILVPALTLAALGTIDSLLTSVVADNLTKTRHNSNRELVGQGMGNMMSAMIGGIPGAGATMRTVVNIRSGGKTRLSGVMHGIFLLVVLLGVGRYASEIPLAVLAGILITVGIGIIDYKGIGDLIKVPRADAIVMTVVVVMTVFVDLLWAVGVGVVLSALFFVKQAADKGQAASSMEPIKMLPEMEDELQDINPAYLVNDVYIQEIHGPLFFGFATKFQEQFHKLPEMRAVIFRVDNLSFADQSGLYAIKKVIQDLQNKNVLVIFSGLQTKVREQFEKIEIIPAMIPSSLCFSSFSYAADWLSKSLQANAPVGGSVNEVEGLLANYENNKLN